VRNADTGIGNHQINAAARGDEISSSLLHAVGVAYIDRIDDGARSFRFDLFRQFSQQCSTSCAQADYRAWFGVMLCQSFAEAAAGAGYEYIHGVTLIVMVARL
jgi:hypothetical protein